MSVALLVFCLTVTLGCNDLEPPPAGLTSSFPHDRLRALATLRVRGAAGGARHALPLLRDPVAEVRLQAVRTLFALGPRTYTEELALRLTDRAREVRLATVEALRQAGTPRAQELLVLMLGDADPSLRRAAESALQQLGLGPRAQGQALAAKQMKQTLAELRSRRPAARVHAVRELGLSEAPQAVEPLLAALEDPSLRTDALHALTQQADARASRILLRALAEEAVPLRRELARELAANAAGRSPATVVLWQQLLQNRDAEVRSVAVAQLVDAESAHVPWNLACAALEALDPLAATRVAQAVERARRTAAAIHCTEEVARLTVRVRSGDSAPARVLAELSAQPVTGALLELAGRILDAYQSASEPWLDDAKWRTLLSDPEAGAALPPNAQGAGNSVDRQRAAQRLMAKLSLPEWRPAAGDVDPLIPPAQPFSELRTAVLSLGGRPGARAWLAQVASNTPPREQALALTALSRDTAIEDPTSRAAVAGAVEHGLASPDPRVQRRALDACQWAPVAVAFAKARALLAASDPHLQGAAAGCLPKLRVDGRVKLLQDALRRAPIVEIIAALGEVGSDQSVGPLIAILESPAPPVVLDGAQQAAIRALSTIGSSQAISAIAAELGHPSRHVRCAAAQALGEIGGERRGSTAEVAMAIERCAEDFYGDVRRACRAARATWGSRR